VDALTELAAEKRRISEDLAERRRNGATELEPLPRFDAALNRVSGAIIESALAVHTALGAGLLESAYEACMEAELRFRGFSVETQVALPLTYRGVVLPAAYRADLIVNGEVLVEVKSVAMLMPVADAQIATYLKLRGLRIGLILNFNVKSMRNGIRRIVR
jgi:GxxExxY protein